MDRGDEGMVLGLSSTVMMSLFGCQLQLTENTMAGE